MGFLIISAVLLALLAYLLLMQLDLVVNTYQQQYYLRVGRLCTLLLEKDPEELVHLRLRSGLVNITWRPSDFKARAQKPKKLRKPKPEKTRKFKFRTLLALLKAVKVKEFRWQLDTADPILNAQLYPLFFFLKNQRMRCSVNFTGENQLALRLSSRPVKFLKAIINP
jgi:hypothetical protein